MTILIIINLISVSNNFFNAGGSTKYFYFKLLVFFFLVVSHQDSTFLFTSPDTLVGFWIALDDATLENGCLWLIPGSHKTDVHKRLIRNSDKCANSQTVFQGTLPEYEKSSYVPAAVKKCKVNCSPYTQTQILKLKITLNFVCSQPGSYTR